jgi:hypothetical protein
MLRNVEWQEIVNAGWESVLKETIVVYCRHQFNKSPNALRKTTNNLSQDKISAICDLSNTKEEC